MARRKTSSKTDPGSVGIWIHYDQLSLESSLLAENPPGEVRVCLIDPIPADFTYAPQKKRLVLILSLVRHFAEALREKGYDVDHYRLDDRCLRGTVEKGRGACLEHFVATHSLKRLRVMAPAEYDDDLFVHGLAEELGIPIDLVPNDRFMVGHEAFSEWYRNAKDPSMESFYEKRRKETNLLMDGETPAGGQWNYDAENRASPVGNLPVPNLPVFEPDPLTRKSMKIVGILFGNFI